MIGKASCMSDGDLERVWGNGEACMRIALNAALPRLKEDNCKGAAETLITPKDGHQAPAMRTPYSSEALLRYASGYSLAVQL